MKILITGGTYGLGKNINETMIKSGYATHLIGSIDSYTHHLPDIINEYDVFINNEYNDTIQTELFEYVHTHWKYEKKTIINILTSALIFDGPNKKYIDDKRNLEQKTFELRTNDKQVRIINVYPNTLESTKTAKNQKLKYSEVSNIIKFVIELPHDIEIFQIGISKTKLKIEETLI
jgi:NADP-dependent 3-hydroxy acid dehydrogenase YdfG